MKSIKKENLPQKICPVCLRAFSWRKKWARAWITVIYCSEWCRGNRNAALSRKGEEPGLA